MLDTTDGLMDDLWRFLLTLGVFDLEQLRRYVGTGSAALRRS
jgi:hypothetical protein